MRSTVLVLSFCLGGHILAQIPTNGLLCYLPFNGSTLDMSGSGNHAFASGTSFATDRSEQPGSALQFNGVADSLRIPIPSFAPIIGDFTISFWLRTSSPEVLNILSLKDSPADTVQNFEMQLNSTYRSQTILELYYASFAYWNGSGVQDADRLLEGSAGEYYNGKWQHYALRRSGDSLQFWHDTYLLSEAYYTGPLGDDGDLVISAAPYRFDGSIDDIAIYDRALNRAELVRMHHDGRPFELMSPVSTDAYVQGDTAMVFWRWDPSQVSDSVDLHYRLNGLGPWLPTDQNNLVDWTPYPIIMNYPVGTTVEVRLRDRLDTGSVVYSGSFVVSEYAWEQVSDELPFSNRDGSGLLSYQDRMWLLGGWDPPFHEPLNTTNEVWSSIDGVEWVPHGEAPWMGRHCSGWLVHADAMWVVGGDLQSGSVGDVWRSDDGLSWTQLHDTIPGLSPLRNSHMTASVNGSILNFGGQPADYVAENLAQVWQSTDGEDWQQLPDAPWKPRGMVLNSCVDDDGAMWLLGGGRLWDRRCYNDVWRTTDGVDWQQVTSAAPWAPRYWHNVAWFDGKLWVVCGVVNQTDNNETWYSEDGIIWHELKQPRYAARHASSVTVHNDALWQMAGIQSGDVWRLRNVTNTSLNIPDMQHAQGLAYPNPTRGMLMLPSAQEATLQSALGVVLDHQQNTSTLDLTPLPAGIYFLTLQHMDGRMSTQRVVKQ